jgi:hypothetical protein
MVELVIAIFSWPVIHFAVWFYSYCSSTELRREPGFEAYCRQAPLIAAFAVQPHAMNAVTEAIVRVTRAGVFNHQGRFPWPSYKLEVEVRRRANIISLHVTRASLKRPREERPELLIALLGELRTFEQDITALWLHGHFYSDGRASKIDHNRVGFSGAMINGQLHLSHVIGLPAWTAHS